MPPSASSSWSPLHQSQQNQGALTPHRIILVIDVPSHEMLLHKKLLNDSVVDGTDGGLELLIELLLGVRNRWRVPVCGGSTYSDAVTVLDSLTLHPTAAHP